MFNFHLKWIALFILTILSIKIGYCNKADKYFEDKNYASLPPKFLCPLSLPTFSWSESLQSKFSWRNKKIHMDNGSDSPFSTPKKEQKVEEACDSLSAITFQKSNESKDIVCISMSKTKENDDIDEHGALFIIREQKSFSQKSLAVDTVKVTTESRGGSFFDSKPSLRCRENNQPVFLVLPEDDKKVKEKNQAWAGKLSRTNYDVIHPETGSETLRAILRSGFCPDCIFTDISMETPQEYSADMTRYISGVDTTKLPAGIVLALTLRALGYTGPIIAVTSDFRDSQKPESLLYKHQDLFQEIRYKIQNHEKIEIILAKHNVRTPHSQRIVSNIFSQLSKSFSS